MNAHAPIETAQPTPLGKPFDPTYFDVDLEGHFYPEVRAFFGDPEPTQDMVSGKSTGIRTELVAISINALQLSRDQAVAILGEAHVSQIEELHAEGGL